MFERFKRSRGRSTDDAHTRGAPFTGGSGFGRDRATDDATAASDRAGVADRPVAGDRTSADDRTATAPETRTGALATAERPTSDRDRPTAAATRPAATAAPATIDEARAVQRERFGGADGTAIFFGWLSAMGLAALLVAVFAAAGTRLGFAQGVNTGDATQNADTIGIVGAAILLGILLLAYYAGGYVAGRMARFDGARQGFRVWLLGLLVTIAAAVAGWLLGSEYNVLEQLNLPRIPVDEGDVTTGAIITLIAVLLGTLLAAVAGGKAGDRYHLRVDRHGWDPDRR